MLPPPPAHRAQVWGSLLLGLVLLCPPLVIGIFGGEATSPGEQVTLAASQSTWHAQAERGGATWLIPQWNGEPRVSQPPLAVWVNMFTWWPLDPATAEPQTLAMRARLAALVFALLTLATTFWAGMSVGGIRVAMLSMLAAGTCVMFARHGRWAAFDVHLAGLTTLAIAAGLWAMRPLKESSGLDRRVIGWLIAGLALGAAMLVVRPPTALGLVALPLALMIAIVPRRRLGNTLGLVFALAVGVLVMAPWVMYIVQQADHLGIDRPLAAVFLGSPLDGVAALADAPTWTPASMALVLLWVAPWPVWLIGGLFQPWLRGEGDRRRQLLIVWVWFLAMLPVLWLAGAAPGYLLIPAIPAAALLIGQLWAYHIRLADRAVMDPGTNRLRLPHWVLVLAVTVALPLYALFQGRFAGWINAWFGDADEALLQPVEWPGLHPAVVIIVGLTLLALAVIGVIWHYRWKPRWGFAATAIWAVLLLSVMQYSDAHSHRATNPYRDDARRVNAAVGAATLFRLDFGPAANPPLSPAFLFYSQRSVPAVGVGQLDEAQPPHEPLYVACAATQTQTAALRSRGFEHVFDFQDGAAPLRHLYRRLPRND